MELLVDTSGRVWGCVWGCGCVCVWVAAAPAPARPGLTDHGEYGGLCQYGPRVQRGVDCNPAARSPQPVQLLRLARLQDTGEGEAGGSES